MSALFLPKVKSPRNGAGREHTNRLIPGPAFQRGVGRREEGSLGVGQGLGKSTWEQVR